MKARYFLIAGLLLMNHALYPRQRGFKELTAIGAEDTDIQRKAFDILNAKCNFCHREDNPSKIFTPQNMNKHAGNIYRQVFVWRRMPKNNAASLSSGEEAVLKRWLRANRIVFKD